MPTPLEYLDAMQLLIDGMRASLQPPEPEPEPQPEPKPVGVTDLTVKSFDETTGKLVLTYTPLVEGGYAILRDDVPIMRDEKELLDTDGTITLSHLGTITYQVRDAAKVLSNAVTVGAGATPGEVEPAPKPPAYGSGITALYGTSGMAPYTVHVHALDIDVADKVHSLYEWDFGDPAGKFNALRGWSAAHFYDLPGEYPVTLTIAEPGGTAQRHRLTVTVAENTRQRVTTIPDVVGSDTELVLLGEYNRTMPLFVKGSNIWIRIDATALLHWLGSNTYTPLIKLDPSCENVVIEGINFSSIHGGVHREFKKNRGIEPAGKNITIRNCHFRDIGDAVNAENRPAGLLLQENTTADELAGYFLVSKGSDNVLLGNISPNSRIEHNARFLRTDRVLCAFNRLSNPGAPAKPGEDKDEYKGTFSPREGEWFYFYCNETGMGPYSIGPLSGQTYQCGPGCIDGDTIGDCFDFWPGAHDWLIRNDTKILGTQDAFNIRKPHATDPEGQRVERIEVEQGVVSNGRVRGDTSRLTFNTVNGVEQ